MATTTHLVCAPDDLLAPAVVTEWLVVLGQQVAADAPLVRLAVSGESQIVFTPMAGLLVEHCIAIGEPLGSCDLLAMIEADEPEIGMLLIDADDADQQLSVPACRLADPLPSQRAANPDAIALCAALGIAPAEVPYTGTHLQGTDVERHVRRELRTLAMLRELLKSAE